MELAAPESRREQPNVILSRGLTHAQLSSSVMTVTKPVGAFHRGRAIGRPADHGRGTTRERPPAEWAGALRHRGVTPLSRLNRRGVPSFCRGSAAPFFHKRSVPEERCCECSRLVEVWVLDTILHITEHGMGSSEELLCALLISIAFYLRMSSAASKSTPPRRGSRALPAARVDGAGDC